MLLFFVEFRWIKSRDEADEHECCCYYRTVRDTHVKMHKLLQVCTQVVTCLFTSCQ